MAKDLFDADLYIQSEWSYNLRKVTRARSVDHRCLFQAMGMRKSTQIGQVWSTGHEIENDVVIQPLEGGQVGQQGSGYVTP